MPTSQYHFLTFILGFAFLIKNREVKDFYESSKLNYCPKSFSRHCRLRIGGKEQKMVMQYTRMNEKETPGVLLIFTATASSLNPKVKQIVHF